MPFDSSRHVPSGAKGKRDRQDVMSPGWLWEAVLLALGRERFNVDLFCDVRTQRNVRSWSSICWPFNDAKVDPWQGEPFRGCPIWSAWGNPPFDSLDWVLERAASMRWDSSSKSELVLLVPLRPHRNFWVHAHTSDVEVHLPAFAFEGEPDSFPFPCALLYWGPRSLQFAQSIREAVAPGGRSPVVVRTVPLTRFSADVIVSPVLKNQIPIAIEAAVRLVTASIHNSKQPSEAWNPRHVSSIQGLLASHSGATRAFRRLVSEEDGLKGWDLLRAHDKISWACESLAHAIAFVLYFADLPSLERARVNQDAGECFSKTVHEALVQFSQKAAPETKPKTKPRAKPSTKPKGKPKAKPKTKPKGKPRTPPKKPTKKPTKRSGSLKAVGGEPPVDDPRQVVIDTEAVEKPANSAALEPVAAPEAVERFVAAKSIGEEWSIAEVLPGTTSSRSTVARELRKRTDTEQVGKGRAAKWKRVS